MRDPTTQAIAMLVGMIVGVGVFALPFAFAQVGFFVGLGFLLVLGVAIVALHLVYGEVTLRTKRSLHLVGYAEKYFGHWGKWALTVVVAFGLASSLLAYIVISGEFIETMVSTFAAQAKGNAFWFSLAFFVVSALLSFFGVRRVARGEFLLAAALIVVVVIISADSLRLLRFENLVEAASGSFFLPYGVVLFSLLGTSAIPEIREMLISSARGRSFRSVIVVGTAIPIGLYALFSLAVVGTTGSLTTPEPFQGLVSFLGLRVVILGSAFGFLAVMTSYLILSLNGIETLMQSYGFRHTTAWAAVSGFPLLLFIFGVRNFISIVEIAGVVVTATMGSAMVVLWWRARRVGDRVPEYQLSHHRLIGVSLISLFVVALFVRVVFL